jgi:UDP-2,3-diacylglucosamine pyrophosphatase LpxH
MAMNGTKVVYITGNHDELLRKFVGMNFGNIELCNQYEVEVNGQKTLFFHGDVFDLSIQHAKWLAKLGGKGYDVLILLNTFINFISEKLGGKRVSLSKKIKNSVKQAVSFINNFEVAAAEYASKVNAHVVVCGHIHHPADKIIETGTSSVRYLNSGDWIENLSALEYHNGIWQTIHVNEVHDLDQQHSELEEPVAIALLKEFQLAK